VLGLNYQVSARRSLGAARGEEVGGWHDDSPRYKYPFDMPETSDLALGS